MAAALAVFHNMAVVLVVALAVSHNMVVALAVLHNTVVALVVSVASVAFPNMAQVCPVSVQLPGLLLVIETEVSVNVSNRELSF